MKEVISKVLDARNAYQQAKKTHNQEAVMRERYVNVLLNSVDDLLGLADAVEKAEAEYAELAKENMRLQAEAKKKKPEADTENKVAKAKE